MSGNGACSKNSLFPTSNISNSNESSSSFKIASNATNDKTKQAHVTNLVVDDDDDDDIIIIDGPMETSTPNKSSVQNLSNRDSMKRSEHTTRVNNKLSFDRTRSFPERSISTVAADTAASAVDESDNDDVILADTTSTTCVDITTCDKNDKPLNGLRRSSDIKVSSTESVDVITTRFPLLRVIDAHRLRAIGVESSSDRNCDGERAKIVSSSERSKDGETAHEQCDFRSDSMSPCSLDELNEHMTQSNDYSTPQTVYSKVPSYQDIDTQLKYKSVSPYYDDAHMKEQNLRLSMSSDYEPMSHRTTVETTKTTTSTIASLSTATKNVVAMETVSSSTSVADCSTADVLERENRSIDQNDQLPTTSSNESYDRPIVALIDSGIASPADEAGIKDTLINVPTSTIVDECPTTSTTTTTKPDEKSTTEEPASQMDVSPSDDKSNEKPSTPKPATNAGRTPTKMLTKSRISVQIDDDDDLSGFSSNIFSARSRLQRRTSSLATVKLNDGELSSFNEELFCGSTTKPSSFVKIIKFPSNGIRKSISTPLKPAETSETSESVSASPVRTSETEQVKSSELHIREKSNDELNSDDVEHVQTLTESNTTDETTCKSNEVGNVIEAQLQTPEKVIDLNVEEPKRAESNEMISNDATKLDYQKSEIDEIEREKIEAEAKESEKETHMDVEIEPQVQVETNKIAVESEILSVAAATVDEIQETTTIAIEEATLETENAAAIETGEIVSKTGKSPIESELQIASSVEEKSSDEVIEEETQVRCSFVDSMEEKIIEQKTPAETPIETVEVSSEPKQTIKDQIQTENISIGQNSIEEKLDEEKLDDEKLDDENLPAKATDQVVQAAEELEKDEEIVIESKEESFEEKIEENIKVPVEECAAENVEAISEEENVENTEKEIEDEAEHENQEKSVEVSAVEIVEEIAESIEEKNADEIQEKSADEAEMEIECEVENNLLSNESEKEETIDKRIDVDQEKLEDEIIETSCPIETEAQAEIESNSTFQTHETVRKTEEDQTNELAETKPIENEPFENNEIESQPIESQSCEQLDDNKIDKIPEEKFEEMPQQKEEKLIETSVDKNDGFLEDNDLYEPISPGELSLDFDDIDEEAERTSETKNEEEIEVEEKTEENFVGEEKLEKEVERADVISTTEKMKELEVKEKEVETPVMVEEEPTPEENEVKQAEVENEVISIEQSVEEQAAIVVEGSIETESQEQTEENVESTNEIQSIESAETKSVVHSLDGVEMGSEKPQNDENIEEVIAEKTDEKVELSENVEEKIENEIDEKNNEKVDERIEGKTVEETTPAEQTETEVEVTNEDVEEAIHDEVISNTEKLYETEKPIDSFIEPTATEQKTEENATELSSSSSELSIDISTSDAKVSPIEIPEIKTNDSQSPELMTPTSMERKQSGSGRRTKPAKIVKVTNDFNNLSLRGMCEKMGNLNVLAEVALAEQIRNIPGVSVAVKSIEPIDEETPKPNANVEIQSIETNVKSADISTESIEPTPCEDISKTPLVESPRKRTKSERSENSLRKSPRILRKEAEEQKAAQKSKSIKEIQDEIDKMTTQPPPKTIPAIYTIQQIIQNHSSHRKSDSVSRRTNSSGKYEQKPVQEKTIRKNHSKKKHESRHSAKLSSSEKRATRSQERAAARTIDEKATKEEKRGEEEEAKTELEEILLALNLKENKAAAKRKCSENEMVSVLSKDDEKMSKKAKIDDENAKTNGIESTIECPAVDESANVQQKVDDVLRLTDNSSPIKQPPTNLPPPAKETKIPLTNGHSVAGTDESASIKRIENDENKYMSPLVKKKTFECKCKSDRDRILKRMKEFNQKLAPVSRDDDVIGLITDSIPNDDMETRMTLIKIKKIFFQRFVHAMEQNNVGVPFCLEQMRQQLKSLWKSASIDNQIFDELSEYYVSMKNEMKTNNTHNAASLQLFKHFDKFMKWWMRKFECYCTPMQSKKSSKKYYDTEESISSDSNSQDKNYSPAKRSPGKHASRRHDDSSFCTSPETMMSPPKAISVFHSSSSEVAVTSNDVNSIETMPEITSPPLKNEATSIETVSVSEPSQEKDSLPIAEVIPSETMTSIEELREPHTPEPLPIISFKTGTDEVEIMHLLDTESNDNVVERSPIPVDACTEPQPMDETVLSSETIDNQNASPLNEFEDSLQMPVPPIESNSSSAAMVFGEQLDQLAIETVENDSLNTSMSIDLVLPLPFESFADDNNDGLTSLPPQKINEIRLQNEFDSYGVSDLYPLHDSGWSKHECVHRSDPTMGSKKEYAEASLSIEVLSSLLENDLTRSRYDDSSKVYSAPMKEILDPTRIAKKNVNQLTESEKPVDVTTNTNQWLNTSGGSDNNFDSSFEHAYFGNEFYDYDNDFDPMIEMILSNNGHQTIESVQPPQELVVDQQTGAVIDELLPKLNGIDESANIAEIDDKPKTPDAMDDEELELVATTTVATRTTQNGCGETDAFHAHHSPEQIQRSNVESVEQSNDFDQQHFDAIIEYDPQESSSSANERLDENHESRQYDGTIVGSAPTATPANDDFSFKQPSPYTNGPSKSHSTKHSSKSHKSHKRKHHHDDPDSPSKKHSKFDALKDSPSSSSSPSPSSSSSSSSSHHRKPNQHTYVVKNCTVDTKSSTVIKNGDRKSLKHHNGTDKNSNSHPTKILLKIKSTSVKEASKSSGSLSTTFRRDGKTYHISSNSTNEEPPTKKHSSNRRSNGNSNGNSGGGGGSSSSRNLGKSNQHWRAQANYN